MVKIRYCKNGYRGISGKFWIVENTKYNCVDMCWSLGSAIRFYLWHVGIPAKYVFKTYFK